MIIFRKRLAMAWHTLCGIFNPNYLPISCIYICAEIKNKCPTVDVMENVAIPWKNLGSATKAIEQGLQDVIERKGWLDDKL